MLGHLGFSYIGLIYLLMLCIPNIIWTKNKPTDYKDSNENKLLLLCEGVGQVSVAVCALIFSDFNPVSFSLWSLWLVTSFVLMIIYEIYWIRYFRGEHNLKNFYRSFYGIPIPGATLPVIAFLLLGIYEKVIWFIISTIIFAIGHIGIHFQHLKELESNK